MRQAIDDMQPVADAAGVQLIHDTTQVEIARRRGPAAAGDDQSAVECGEVLAAQLHVSVMLRPGINGVTVSVIDQGRGIPADKLEAIFGRFQQVDASDSRQKGGSGLGLAICRTIVLQHSGRIWAERNPVRGSTFRVFLPYQPAPVADSRKACSTRSRGHGHGAAGRCQSAARPQIAAQLTAARYRVVETTTVEQTLAAAHEGVEAILLDTSLDGMNGWEILPAAAAAATRRRARRSFCWAWTSGRTPADFAGGAEGRVANRAAVKRRCWANWRACSAVPGEKARILIVEDDVDLARVIGEVFSRDSIEVELAHSLPGGARCLLRLPAAPAGAGYRPARRRRLQRGGLAAQA